MKKVISAIILLTFSSTAQAGMYVSAGLGLNVNDSQTIENGIKSDYDNSAFYTGAVGYALPVLPVRAEIEGFYNKSKMEEDATGGHMTSYGALVNVYGRIPVIGLYAGAGAGYASVKSKNTPVYQGMIGVEYGLFGLNLGIEYRHLQSSQDIDNFNEKSRFKTDVVMLKARFEF